MTSKERVLAAFKREAVDYAPCAPFMNNEPPGLASKGGKTFRTRDVEVREGEYSYPKLLQTKDGIRHLFCTHRRKRIQHAWFDEEWLLGGRNVFSLIDS